MFVRTRERDDDVSRSVDHARSLVAALNAELDGRSSHVGRGTATSGGGGAPPSTHGRRLHSTRDDNSGARVKDALASSFGSRLAALTVSDAERGVASHAAAPAHADPGSAAGRSSDKLSTTFDAQSELSSARTPLADWLSALRLDRFGEHFVALGVVDLIDLAEVRESDLEAAQMPRLQCRRFAAAVQELSLPATPRPSTSAPPSAWLAWLRLEAYAEAFEKLGVQVPADLVDVTSDDLNAMHMMPLQQRRFVSGRPELGGAAAAAKAAGARAAAASPGSRVAEWLAVLRLSPYGPSLGALGVEDVQDLAEVPMRDVLDMGMPPLAQRRFALAASRAAQRPGGLPLGPDAAVAAVAAQAASCGDAREWLDALRLGGYAALLIGGLGVEHPWDFKEVTEDDCDSRIRMPPLQRTRFFVAAAATPDVPPPPQTARRQATGLAAVTAWLAAARLTRYQSALVALGVTSPLCCTELIVPDDLDALQMPPLHQRRFLAACSATGTDAKALLPTLDATPAAWLAAIRCEQYTDAFSTLGVASSADFAEILLSDLNDMGLPLLHRRRFAGAAAAAHAALTASARDAAACLAAAAAARDVGDWLATLRLSRVEPAFEALGVERVHDFVELLPGDLQDVGLLPIETRRFKQAVSQLLRRVE
jgi:hypothetical protein